MTQNCPNCGSSIQAGTSFCRSCGTRVQQETNACARCGTANAAGATFCANCGNAMQAQQQPQYGTAQRPFQQPAMPVGSSAGRNKWLLPGVGGVIAAVAIVGVVLMMGGSDSGKKKDGTDGKVVVQAKAVVAPAKVDSTNETLADTIANLNKAQLKVAEETKAPTTPKAVDLALVDVSTHAMRAAELATVMAKSATNQGSDGQAASEVAAQYGAIAQTAYGQVLEAQNLRESYAAGSVSAAQVAESTADYGARMWNSGVTTPGVTGNPFVPYLPPTSQVSVSVNLSPGSAASITTQVGSTSVSIWVASAPTVVYRPVLIPVIPTPIFDPFDPTLSTLLLTPEGQYDMYIVRRAVLARLQQWRFGPNPGIIIDGFTPWAAPPFSPYGNIPLFAVPAPQTYVNIASAPLDLLPTTGYVNVVLPQPSGMAFATEALLKEGYVPSYPGGTAMAFSKTSAAELQGKAKEHAEKNGLTQVPKASTFNLDPGGTTALFHKGTFWDQPTANLNISASATATAKDASATEATVAISVTWVYSPGYFSNDTTSVTVDCDNGAGQKAVSGLNGTVAFSAVVPVVNGSVSGSCWAQYVRGTIAGGLNAGGALIGFNTTDAGDSWHAIVAGANEKEATAKQEEAKKAQDEAIAKNAKEAKAEIDDLQKKLEEKKQEFAAIAKKEAEDAAKAAEEAKQKADEAAKLAEEAAKQAAAAPPPAAPAPPRPANVAPPPANNPPAPQPPAPAPPAPQPPAPQPPAPQPPTQPQVQQPPPNPCPAGAHDSGATGHAGGSSTKALDTRCMYRICLSSSVSAKAPGAASASVRTPQGWQMQASPGGAFSAGTNPCVLAKGTGGVVSFFCSASAFAGFTGWTGGFAYSITRTGPA